MPKEKQFWGCGCCGREIGEIAEWCKDCEKHVTKAVDPWDRTYFAQFNKGCPFAENRLAQIYQEQKSTHRGT